MSILIKQGIPEDMLIPAPALAGMSDEAFFDFAANFPNLQIERDKHGNITIMPPAHLDTGEFESEANAELVIWNRKTGAGKVYSPSTGFVLPDSAMRGPDASWISNERLAGLPEGEGKRFARICPDFVLEIRSDSDNLQPLKAKMAAYIENGARLGFLIDPKGSQAFIYHADGSVEQVRGLDGVLSGEPVLPGFSMPLSLFKSS